MIKRILYLLKKKQKCEGLFVDKDGKLIFYYHGWYYLATIIKKDIHGKICIAAKSSDILKHL